MAAAAKQDQDVHVKITRDGMRALASCRVTESTVDEVLRAIVARARAVDVAVAIDEAALKQALVEAAEQDGVVKELQVAAGTPPGAPQDGTVEWARDFFNADYVRDEQSDQVDFRERLSQANVKQGDLLGRIIPPKPGRLGQDVLGQVSRPRRPEPARIRAGAGVRLDEASGQLLAGRDGRVRLDGNRLCVEDVYEVPGSVGLESGNVHFRGHVVVVQDIEDMATVEAGSGLDVGGFVGAATITCGGDVDIRRGLTGHGKATLDLKGILRAGYITNATVTAHRGVVVRREIVQCNVKTRGEVQVKRGRIAGGEVTALGRIIVDEAGSDGGVPTLLVAGEDYELAVIVGERQEQIKRLQKLVDKINNSINPLIARLRTLRHEQREAVTELMARAGEAEETIENLQQEVENAIRASHRQAGKQIIVTKALYQGVTLRIDGARLVVADTLKGPLVAEPDPGGETVSLKPLENH